MVVSRMADQVGRVLSGRYRLIAPIGTGASALVFLADDTRLRRRVAVKILHQGLADDDAFIRRFRAEAHAAAALNHQHIVAVYDWGDDDHEPYLVTEYLGGGSLRALLDGGHRLSLSQTLLVGLESARALDYAHTRGFVHRDIKPANLLFGEEGRLRVGDFGLARALAEAAWTEPAGAMVGTARYACPEQARGEPVDGKGDVYSLALVLIEAVTGKVPFASDTTIATLMARVDRDLAVPDALGTLKPILEQAGRRDPSERPDAAAFAVGLLAAAEGLPRPEPLPLAGATLGSGDLVVIDRDPTQLPPRTEASVPDDPAPEPVVELAPEEPRRRRGLRRALLAVGLVALLVLLGAGAVYAKTHLLVPSHKVPVLSGLSEADARTQAQQRHWKVRTVQGRQDNSTPGSVIGQDPPPGKNLQEDKTITLTVSLGNTLVAVPTDLANQTIDQATAELQAAGLAVGNQIQQHDENVPTGVVISLAPGTPAQVPKAGTVDLVVSNGPAPRTVPAIPSNATFDQASQALSAVQLAAKQDTAFSDTVPAGQVIGTDPGEGSQVPRGTTVRVIFSKGPQPIPIPDVSGQSVSDASAALRAAGFAVTGVSGDPGKKVKGTDPPAGSPQQKGTGVVLITGG